jgi:putative transcriptional regulator
MHTPALPHTDALVRLSRRSLWTAFILLALIGAAGMSQLLSPASQTVHHLRLLLPIFPVIGAVSLRRVPNAGMQIVLADELRQVALALKIERVRRDLTQAQLADLAGTTRKSVDAIETGNMVPSMLLALKLAQAMGVTVDALFYLESGSP